MAMLAGPRQKKRYQLTPKGKPLFEDNDRFGTKMLEKMGWSKGKGLGKTEDGNQEFVRMRFKADDRGLGYEERDDQWTEHEKQFNGLLENLNGDSKPDPDDYDMVTPAVGLGFAVKKKKNLKDKISGQSLEEKSKNSKVRVHYKKFTKGKDMSRYSEKDLANIFGKKATTEDSNIYDQFQAFSQNNEKEENEKQLMPSETPIVNTGVSVNDYFKSKMDALKAKQGSRSSNPFDSNVRIINNVEVFVPSANRKSSNDDEEPEEEQVPRKKKKTKSLEVEEPESVVQVAESEENQETQAPRKKKKCKKLDIEQEELTMPAEEPESVPIVSKDVSNEEAPKKKKKDKKKKQELEADTDDQNHAESHSEESNSSKKKKKSKNVTVKEINNEENIETPSIAVEYQIPKKKNKKDKKETTDKSEETQNSTHAETENVKESSSQNIAEETPLQEENIKSTKSKTKKNKTKTNTTTNAAEVSSHPNDLITLKNKNNILLDIYTISPFCAEKFRHLELQLYRGSNLTNLTGYGLSENLELNVQNISNDAERIMNLWSGKSDKYADATSRHKLYSNYMEKVKKAKNTKGKIPTLKLGSLKRKHVFQCV